MSPVEDDMAFRALANPARRRVLPLVRDQLRAVGDLTGELGMSQPATGQHLSVLRDAGLVRVEHDVGAGCIAPTSMRILSGRDSAAASLSSDDRS